MTEVDFDSLCAERDSLRNYVLVHASSLRVFEEEGKPWFRRGEKPDSEDTGDRPVRHVTSTASCLQSLGDVPLYATKSPPPPCPRDPKTLEEWRNAKTEDFTRALLSANDDVWLTEGEPLTYTKVRTLPVILQLARDQTLKEFQPKLKSLLEEVWAGLDISDSRSQAIGEGDLEDREGYPPNAFHTYWAIRLLRECQSRGLLKVGKELRSKEGVARLWSRRVLATQTALISQDRQPVDAQQLAWALSTDVLCRPAATDQPTTTDHQHAELYQAALRAFFSEQEDGQWRLYEPLFHYARAGNAYCYTYETLAELLRLALLRKHGHVLRNQLKPYAANLIEAWHFARRTALDLESEHGALGWSSGHHPHRTAAESWATASVFSYLQNLRCLLGLWAAEEAKLNLSVKVSDGGAKEAGMRTLGERGDTWLRPGTQTVGRQLAMLFLHPLVATMADEEDGDKVDPDTPLVEESRSAVLFGPPGGSKTSIVSGLANALGWDYVEVLASDFLRKGMDRVPEAADAIFKKLMELDHCVILFDEIDELIRLRDGGGSDPFGRFLTTSMLPKLAKLWEQRRVLFFVATNDVAVADPAIKRSQRFDAAIFVPPPSFEKKKRQLEKILHREVPELQKKLVEEALAQKDGAVPSFGVFAFLRWDQIDDLANRIELSGDDQGSSLQEALQKIGVGIERTDWRKSNHNSSDEEPESPARASDFQEMFKRWEEQSLDERRDYRNKAVLRLGDDLAQTVPEDWKLFEEKKGYVVVTPEVEGALAMDCEGVLEVSADALHGRDKSGIFVFEKAD